MSYVPSIQRNVVDLQQLNRVATATKGELNDAHTQLFNLRRDTDGKVPASDEKMSAAIAQISRANDILNDYRQSLSKLPQASEAVKLLDKGATGMERVMRLVTAKSIDPAKLDDAMPYYEFQEAGLAALRDSSDLGEGLNTLARGAGIATLPKSIAKDRLVRMTNGLTELAGHADEAYQLLSQAEDIATARYESLSKQNPNAAQFAVPRHFLESWGVVALADKALKGLEFSWDLKVPEGADSRYVHERVADNLQSLRQQPTDPLDETRVDLKAVVRGLGRAASTAARHRNEAKAEAHQMELLELYGRRG
jgi:hypothetical protein